MADPEEYKGAKFFAWVAQWLMALVTFAMLTDAKDSPVKFAVGVTVLWWLALTVILIGICCGKIQVHFENAKAEFIGMGILNFFLFVSFIAIAANTDGAVEHKVAAGFSFFLW